MKTIEEAAKEYASNNTKSRLSNHITKTDFKAGAEFAQQWIPVEEELPGKGDDIIVKSDESKSKYLIFVDVDDIDIHEISFMATHWRNINIE